ncbi:MAG: PEGA domain-containing protein [Ignavibacteriae bacterium]|nr:PEGA domain-containing protein [Ignavibacteriota bacterium]MCB0753851.1 PEGA domain-containing protein [Ignavibacteriota bacterium]
MKKILILVLIAFLGITFTSCNDSTTDPIPVVDTGSILVTSTPAGASIWINKSVTGEVTPFTFADQDVAVYEIKLTLDNYKDTTLFVDVLKDQEARVTVELTPTYTKFGPVEFWESLDPSSTHPSGVSLNLGTAYSISSSNDNSAKIDLYYDSDGFLIISASNRTSNSKMTRETYFSVGSSANLNDGVNSPVKDNTWAKSISVTERNYVFIYDQDGHYSKLLITKETPGTFDTYGSVVVEWIYNKAKDSVVF